MKPVKHTVAAALCLVVLLCSGCTSSLYNRSVPSAEAGDPFLGIAVTNASGPFAITAADGDLRTGISNAYSILDFVSFGDATSATASRNGDIDIIKEASVDIFRIKVLGIPIFKRYTTVVTGK